MHRHHPAHLIFHPTLREAAGETSRLCALLALYAILIGFFALAALGIWVELPSAMLDSRLISVPSSAGTVETVKLRGSL